MFSSPLSRALYFAQVAREKMLVNAFLAHYIFSRALRVMKYMERWMEAVQTPKPPYKVKEFAAAARVSPNAVYEMVRRGEVPAVRFGNAIRIPRDAGDRKLRGDAG
jgi:excisionase family DNA binding protein